MRILRSFPALLLLTLLIYACSQNTEPGHSNKTKDSILNSFFRMIDTLPYYDTNNIDYRLLKGYSENDTLSMKSAIDYVRIRSVKPWMNRYLEPNIKNQEFDSLKADEAYRFVYTAAFCEYQTEATIIQIGNKVKTRVIVYKNASAMDSIPCTIAQENETEINSYDWAKFKEAMIIADFWGLKEDNGYDGNDGSTLEVFGYQKAFRGFEGNFERRSYVSRWSRSMERLVDPFLMLLRSCKITTGCLRPA